jgi:hypothetical protein
MKERIGVYLFLLFSGSGVWAQPMNQQMSVSHNNDRYSFPPFDPSGSFSNTRVYGEKKGPHFSFYFGIGAGGNAGTALAPAPSPPSGVEAYLPLQSKEIPGFDFSLGFDIRLFSKDRFSVRLGLGMEGMQYSGTVKSYEQLSSANPPVATTVNGGWDYAVFDGFVYMPLSFIYRVSAQNKRYVSVKLGITESLLLSEKTTDQPADTYSPRMMTFATAGMIYKIRMTNDGGPAIYLEPALNYQLTPNTEAGVPDNRRFWSFEIRLRFAHSSS